MFLQKTFCFSSLLLQLLLILLLRNSIANGDDEQKNFYIVFLAADPDISTEEDSLIETHLNVLSAAKGSNHDEARESMVYSYTKSFNAFAAKLSEDEVRKLSDMDEVVSVIPNRYQKLHTTRSWDFIGLPLTAKRRLKLEGDVIVGLLDTGVTPESESFKDDGLGPPPAKWKGSCGHFANFSGCNNKLIGAKYFKLDGDKDPEDILSPVDVDGHGSHTSSTAAGNLIQNASLFGLAKGTARGAVPLARVAVYKVCWESSGCADMDILAAFEAAIHDGVDVISISIGGGNPSYDKDSIAIGAFHAMRKGIITVASAGNDGPSLGTVVNTAPWIVTVGASSIDRQFISTVQLGNGKNITGRGVNTFNPKQKQYPLITGADAANDPTSRDEAGVCFEAALDPKKVKGRLVYCESASSGSDSVVKGFGGIGAILENDQYLDLAQIFMAPATSINETIGGIVANYIKSTRSPSAVIYRTHEVKRQAPLAASFSSRGPNPSSIHVLKPDIAAPGINILASYTLKKSLTGLKGDTQFSKFTLMSGTSMACPHVAGVAAYVKSFRPTWSPAAIRSAIITTAKPMSKKANIEAEFAYGAGQVNPTRALNPGLVYDMDAFAYVQFLCHEGYSNLSILTGSHVNCSSILPGLGHDAINYPTIQLNLQTKRPTTLVFQRTVTNVGPGHTTYNATVTAPLGVNITVRPMSLSFSRTLQKRSFKVLVKAKSMASLDVVSGSLVWRSPRYIVRSPIVVYSR